MKLVSFLALGLSLLFYNLAAQAAFIAIDEPPPGFEGENISRHERVRLLVMNQLVDFHFVTIHQDKLQFMDVERIVAQIQGLKNSSEVMALLKSPFVLNTYCSSQENKDTAQCKALNKQLAFILYDPEKQEVSLFINERYFTKESGSQNIQFIPASTANWSYMNKLGGTASFNYASELKQNYYNLFSNNVWAKENNSFIANLSNNNGLDDAQRFQIQNTYFQRIQRDKVYTGGYLLSPMSPFFQTQTIVGFGVQTTLNTVKNAASIMATPVVLFIPQASQVSIFKNEQLIFSEYLAAGYQTINTSSFPDGGYDLTVKIGPNNTLHQFFTKGSILPPPKAPQYYLTAGYLTNGMGPESNSYNYLPDTIGVAVLQAGFNQRINNRLALFHDLLLDSNQGYYDFGPTFFLRDSYIKVAGLITSKSNYGFYTMLSTQKRKFNFNVIATKIFYKNPEIKNNVTNIFLGNLTDNDSVSMSYLLSSKDLLGLQANYTRAIGEYDSYGTGGYFQHEIARYNHLGFFFNASANRTLRIGNSYFASLSVQFSEGSFSGSEAIVWQNQNNFMPNNKIAKPLIAQGNMAYTHQNEVGVGYALTESHTVSSAITSVASTYNYVAPQAFVSSYMNYNHAQGEGRGLGYGGSVETQMVLNQNGINFNGINRFNTSGIIARVNVSNKSSSEKAEFALLDQYNRKIAILPANKNVFIPLPGFTDQHYTLVNMSHTEYHIKEPTQHVTLYPGNVGKQSWSVSKQLIVIGRLQEKDWSHALDGVWIHLGDNGIFSDKDGYFQLELPQQTKKLVAEDHERQCTISLPELVNDKPYLYLGNVSCTP